jgi:subtilisin family serine protease
MSKPLALQAKPIGAAHATLAGSIGLNLHSAAGLIEAAAGAGSVATADMGRLYDSERVMTDSVTSFVYAPSAQDVEGSDEEAAQGRPTGVAAEAAALHKAYEKTAAKRFAAAGTKINQVKSGRFALRLVATTRGEKVAYEIGVVFEGKVYKIEGVDALAAEGKIPEAEWSAARKEQDKAEHAAVHVKMDALVRAAAIKGVKEIQAVGRDLQAWGLPIQIAVNQKTYMRYSKLYRLNGIPTDLGAALHKLLAPLAAVDPKFLSKITSVQLHEAVQFLSDSLKYTYDTSSADGQKRFRLGGGLSSGYDYPEVRKSLTDLAQRALTETPQKGDKRSGFIPVPEERLPAEVLKKIVAETLGRIQRKIKTNAPKSEIFALAELLGALYGAIGIPAPTRSGTTAMMPVQHSQLIPILAELKRRRTNSDIVKTVIRSFPLGESLVRLGVHKLWEQGITGKGIKVAVLDNGVDFDHPDFAGAKTYSENLTRDRGLHTKGGHGTPMASILHAIAPDAEIQSYQVLANTERLPGVALSGAEIDAAILSALDRAAANGARIISMSLGTPRSYSNDAVAAKIAELTKKGIVVIASAGNSGDALPKGWQVGSPGTSPDAIAVGAVDYHGKKADFSSEGVVFNPTTNTAAVKPDIYAYGVNVKAAMALPKGLYAQEPVPFEYGSGTSPAAPHVAGVVALLLSAAAQAGGDVAKTAVLGAVREGLAAGIQHVERLPVLADAVEAVKAFVTRVRASV